MNRWQALIELIQQNKYKKIAEIGVHHGKTSRKIIESCVLDEYYLIDIEHYQPLMEYAVEKQMESGMFIQYWTKPNLAVMIIDDHSLDLVFLDALHDYGNVTENIQQWRPKVRTGGILCGDDYNQSHCEGVKQAVDEMFGDSVELIPIGEKGVKIWVVRL